MSVAPLECVKPTEVPFDLNSTTSRISRVTIMKQGEQLQPEVSKRSLFKGVTSLCYKGYIYGRNGKYTKSTGEKNYYFLCNYCKNRITIQVNAKREKYKIIAYDYSVENPHLESCPRRHKSDEVLAGLAEMRAFAQKLYSENSLIFKPSDLLPVVLREYAIYNRLHKHDPLPFIKNQTILNWFYSSGPKTVDSDGKGIIPPHLWRINDMPWVILDLQAKSRIIIIASPQMINTCDSVDRICIDGTFQSAPTGFSQVLNCVGYFPAYKRTMPLLHVLMQNKQSATYLEVLCEIFQRISFSQLKSINFDFELGFIVALRTYFMKKTKYNGSRKFHFQGCLFHWSQCIRKKFIELYGAEQLTIYYQSFLNVPMLDSKDFESFIIYMRKDQKIESFMQYFEIQWIKTIPRSIWAINNQKELDERFDFSKLDERCTNDSVENYNGRADKLMDHPSLSEFLQKTFILDMNIYTNTLNAYQSKTLRDQSAPHLSKDDAKMIIQGNFPDMFNEGKMNSKFLSEREKLHRFMEEIERIPDNTLINDISTSMKHSMKRLTTKKPRDHSRSHAGSTVKGKQRREHEKRIEKELTNYTDEILEESIRSARANQNISLRYKDHDNSDSSDDFDIIEENAREPPIESTRKRGRPRKVIV